MAWAPAGKYLKKATGHKKLPEAGELLFLPA
jgi:hypothetical protein